MIYWNGIHASYSVPFLYNRILFLGPLISTVGYAGSSGLTGRDTYRCVPRFAQVSAHLCMTFWWLCHFLVGSRSSRSLEVQLLKMPTSRLTADSFLSRRFAIFANCRRIQKFTMIYGLGMLSLNLCTLTECISMCWVLLQFSHFYLTWLRGTMDKGQKSYLWSHLFSHGKHRGVPKRQWDLLLGLV